MSGISNSLSKLIDFRERIRNYGEAQYEATLMSLAHDYLAIGSGKDAAELEVDLYLENDPPDDLNLAGEEFLYNFNKGWSLNKDIFETWVKYWFELGWRSGNLAYKEVCSTDPDSLQVLQASLYADANIKEQWRDFLIGQLSGGYTEGWLAAKRASCQNISNQP